MPRSKYFLLLLVVILLVLGGGGYYFYDCAQNNHLFANERQNYQDYRYRPEDRLRFCLNFIFQPRSPKNPDQSVSVPIMGTRAAFRIEEGQEHPPYNSEPATSGWNYQITGSRFNFWRTINNKTYQESIQSEVAVSKLYAGFVWIKYRTGAVSGEGVEKLKSIAASTPLVFVTGRKKTTERDYDIALSALGRQDKFNLQNGELSESDITRIWDFILRYRNQPEPRAGDFLEE